MKLLLCIFVILFHTSFINSSIKIPKNYTSRPQNVKYSNPSFVSDRFKIMSKPDLPETFWNKPAPKKKKTNGTKSNATTEAPTFYKRPAFNPAWMDYCDPYHCNDYHKIACGLNRKTMKFKWFQSTCHLILNNMCSTYRGFLKFDRIENKHCMKYVMFLRSRCGGCQDDSLKPVCAMSITDQHVVIFRNKCAMEKANCAVETLDDYIQVEMNICALVKIYEAQYPMRSGLLPVFA